MSLFRLPPPASCRPSRQPHAKTLPRGFTTRTSKAVGPVHAGSGGPRVASRTPERPVVLNGYMRNTRSSLNRSVGSNLSSSSSFSSFPSPVAPAASMSSIASTARRKKKVPQVKIEIETE